MNDRSHIDTSSTPQAPISAPQGDLMGSLRHEMNRLFDGFLPSAPFSYRRRMPLLEPMRDLLPDFAAVPPMDLVEDDSAFVLTRELPGLAIEDVNLRITNDMISVSAEKSESHETKKGEHHINELRYGTFQRAMALPPGVSADGVEATFKNGVLRITLPKSEDAKKSERAIEIRAA